MRKLSIAVILAISVLIAASAPARLADVDFAKTWIKIDSLESAGLYRSALKLADQVYRESRILADQENEIKSLIYRLKYTQELEEQGNVAAISILQKEAEDDRLVPRALKYSLLGELLHRYYEVNRWELSQKPDENKASGSPLEIDPVKAGPAAFYRAALESYRISLNQTELLAKIPLSSIKGLLTGSLSDTLNQSSLFDLLTHRAIRFLEMSEEYPVMALRPVSLCSSELFAERKVFCDSILSQDQPGEDSWTQTLLWYAQWLRFSPDNLKADLNRLEYVKSVSCHSEAGQLYESAVKNLLPAYANTSRSAEIFETLANYHLERAGRYQINAIDTEEFVSDRTEARQWLEKAVVWEGTTAGLNCKNLLTSLMAPEYTVLTESVQIPGSWIQISIEYRNISKLYYRIYRINPLEYQSDWLELESDQKVSKLAGLKTVRRGEWNLNKNNDLNPHRVNQLLEPLQPGFYLIAACPDKEWDASRAVLLSTPYTVSRIGFVSRVKEPGAREFYFRDRSTGEALKGLKVTPMYGEYDPASRRSVLTAGKKAQTEEEGKLVLIDSRESRKNESSEAYRLLAVLGTDTLLSQESFYQGFEGPGQRRSTFVKLFTDRSIYKPGHRVWFRGILVDRIGDSLSVHHSDSVQVTFQDPRYQVLGRYMLAVDSLGVFSGFYDVPGQGLTGNYTLMTPFGSVSFSIEYYSRPSFSISLNPEKQPYLNGDTLKVSGKVVALSGESLANAEVLVETDLARAIGRGGFWPGMNRRTRVNTTRIKTNENGEFTWKWGSIPEESNPFGKGTILDYEINFQVTDISGETHEERARLICGKGSMGLRMENPGRISLGDTLWVKVNSASGTELPVEVRLSRLENFPGNYIESVLPEPDRFVISAKDWRKRVPLLPYRKNNLPENLKVKELVARIDGVSDQGTGLRLFTGVDWPEGWYKIDISSPNPAVRIPESGFIYMHKSSSGKIPGDKDLFASVNSTVIKPGDKLVLQEGTTGRGFILTQLQLPDGTMVDWWAESGRKINETSWTTDAAWKGGASIATIMIRNNRVYQERLLIKVPREKTKLFITGLDPLVTVKPGDSVNLNLHVTDDTGIPVVGSLAITVYDASLDKIRKHSWPGLEWPVFSGRPAYESELPRISGSYQLNFLSGMWEDVPYEQPLELNWWGMGYYGIARLEAAMPVKAAVQEKGLGMKTVKAGAENREENERVSDAIEKDLSEVQDEESASVQVEIRKDFRETALFAGQVVTNKEGNAIVKFKVPEVFTEWRILVAGHTAGMAAGSAEHVFRSSKDLMLKPNFPLFMRQGDTLQLVSRLGWYGNKPLSPETKLSLSTEGGENKRDFDPFRTQLLPSSASLLTWGFKVTKPGMMIFNLVSKDGDISDGIQDTVTVYPDKAMLWRSQAFFMGKSGNKTIQIPVSPKKAQVEITTTPAWQVLLSLPAVTDNEKDCSEYWFSRLYLAGLTGIIGDKFPEARKFYLANSEEEILDSLNHPLTRNQDIKGKSWEKTPWSQVLKNEKSRILQIKKWMDPDKRNTELAYSLEKIASLQNSDGSWPWFRGMGSDWYTTMQIVAGFGELKGWQVLDVTATQRGSYMVAKALEGLDGWMSSRFRDLMRQDSSGNLKVQLDPLLIQYLYTRSFYSGWTISPKDEIAWLYFMERIPLEWTSHDPGLQAVMAITLIQSGKMVQSIPIYKSLRERMMESEEMGAWWPRKGYASEWYQWDIWMQSKMIELFAALDEGRKDLNRLRLYLVQQKRGRDWGNGLVAAWASKSLLFFGSALDNKPAPVSFKWGSDVFSSLRVKTGSSGLQGYYRFNWETPDVLPKSNRIEFTHAGDNPAWGAVYTLEEHSLEELKSSEGPLTVRRNLLVGLPGNTWQILKPGQNLAPGTRIKIRIEIKSDRQLSYVELKDYLGTGFKPVSIISGYRYHAGTGWYQAREPEAVIFYIPVLPKGDQVFEYEVFAEQAGNYFGGYAELQSMYAPEFRAWSNSSRVRAVR